MRPIIAILCCAAMTACHESGTRRDTGEPIHAAEVDDYEDVERHDGEFVRVEGIFTHERGDRVFVTTDKGLVVLIPHFDRFKRGDDWLKYSGEKVVVIGRLRKYIREGDGYNRPTLMIQYFKPVDPYVR